MKKKPSNGSAKEFQSRIPHALSEAQTFKACPISIFKFNSTKDLSPSNDFIAQARAVRAIEVGLGIRKAGYNIYVAGHAGTGKTSVIRSYLEKWSKKDPIPPDWVYVFNFNKPECPQAIHLPAGEAKRFKKKMDAVIKDLRYEIPKAFQSEEYENSVNTYMSAANERKSKLFSELEKFAKSMDFSLKSSRTGIETVPMIDGHNISEKEYGRLDEKQRDEIEAKRAKLEPEVLDFVRKVRAIEQETKEFIDTLRSDLGSFVVGNLLEPILHEYEEKEIAPLVEHLTKTKQHILENLLDFLEHDDGEEDEEYFPQEEKDPFKKYTVNDFIDNSETKGGPVVIESNPTYYNLFGKIEKNVEHGVYHTDHTMVKSGAVHKANGGYLVLNITDIFRTPAIWETLKRVLRNREAFIEDMGEQYSMLPTSGLRPEPVPLDVKVILIGNDEIYHLLYEEDEDFRKIFKIKAEFDYKMERTAKNINGYVAFIATRTIKEKLLPFDRSAIATIIEYSSRVVDDQNQLSTKFSEMKDLTIEADFVAREQSANIVRRKHVEQALDEKFFRLNLIEDHIYDAVKHEDIILSVTGEKIGQINGLTVYDMGDYSFGKICRITCTTAISDDGIINIERASRLSGRTHDKGIYILSGFLNALLAKEHSLGVSASICFEQNYGHIDGDSASAAELIAVISAMAELPIHQSFAITGSINQMGEIQAIGGVNEKIEGFFKICELIGSPSQTYSVIIPEQNVDNLMLHRDIRKEIKAGRLKIFPVKYLWEAFMLITGVALGVKDVHAKSFTENSALAIIADKIRHLHDRDEKLRQHDEPMHHTHRTVKKVAKSPAKRPRHHANEK